jgi:hypothetical protein
MRIAAAVILLCLTLPAVAQTDKPADPLRGPQVAKTPRPTSLVERDFSGRLKRLDVPPEEAALDILRLDAATKAKTDQILAARAQILDKIVQDNIDLVVRFANARQAGDKAGQLAALNEFSGKLQPLNVRGKLADELRNALPREKTARFDNLINDYRRALADEDMADAQARGENLTRLQVNLRQNLQSLGVEIKRSYERTIAAKSAEFEQLISQLSLRPEQEAKVRSLVTDFVQRTQGKATPDQRRDLFFKIMAELDPDQQKALMNAYMGRPAAGGG